MKAKEVLRVLGITRPTLCKYVKQGLVKVDSVINGLYRYNRYNADSVYALLTNYKSESNICLQNETNIL